MDGLVMSQIPWPYLQANLVTQSDIARRLRLDKAIPTQWKQQHVDWPDPVLTFATWAGGGGADLYWWPDIEAFCVRHQVVPGKGMPRGRPKGARDGSRRNPKLADPEWLRREYETLGRSTVDIARQLGCSPQAVNMYLRAHGIRRRAARKRAAS